MANKTIGLIAGNGQFPILFAKAAKAEGWTIHATAYREETDPALTRHVDTLKWLYVGQLKRLIKYFHGHAVCQAVMLGGIRKARLFTTVKPDLKAVALLAGLRHTHDDAVMRKFAEVLEAEGIAVKPSTFLLPDLLAPAGIWTHRKPTSAEKADIEMGWPIAKEIGRLDIGQCVVVGGGSVLAVEAIDGTDATIVRGGQLAKEKAVVVKVCKPSQDRRFDLPAVGLETIQTMHRADAGTLVIEAGKTIVFDRHAMVKLADDYKMAIIAIETHPPATAD